MRGNLAKAGIDFPVEPLVRQPDRTVAIRLRDPGTIHQSSYRHVSEQLQLQIHLSWSADHQPSLADRVSGMA